MKNLSLLTRQIIGKSTHLYSAFNHKEDPRPQNLKPQEALVKPSSFPRNKRHAQDDPSSICDVRKCIQGNENQRRDNSSKTLTQKQMAPPNMLRHLASRMSQGLSSFLDQERLIFVTFDGQQLFPQFMVGDTEYQSQNECNHKNFELNNIVLTHSSLNSFEGRSSADRSFLGSINAHSEYLISEEDNSPRSTSSLEPKL